jgi:hypothetical protein
MSACVCRSGRCCRCSACIVWLRVRVSASAASDICVAVFSSADPLLSDSDSSVRPIVCLFRCCSLFPHKTWPLTLTLRAALTCRWPNGSARQRRVRPAMWPLVPCCRPQPGLGHGPVLGQRPAPEQRVSHFLPPHSTPPPLRLHQPICWQRRQTALVSCKLMF